MRVLRPTAPTFTANQARPALIGERLRASTRRRQRRAAILRGGIIVRLTASGRGAFRAQPVTVTVTAHVRGRTLATVQPTSLRPGAVKLRLRDARDGPHLMRAHRRTEIVVTITVRDGAGVQRHRLKITSTP